MTKLEPAWLAGRLKGEPNSPRVVIVMTGRDIVERVARLVSVNYIYMSHPKAERWKPDFKGQRKGARAAELMRVVRRWMGARCGPRLWPACQDHR